MRREEAEGLLAIAREANLLGPDAKSWIDRLAPKRQDLVEAVRFLAENGDEEAAAELGANVWRLWLVLGDIAGGRQMLSAALGVRQGKPSRVRRDLPPELASGIAHESRRFPIRGRRDLE